MLGMAIKFRRMRKGLTQIQFAEKVNMTVKAVQAIEWGRRNIIAPELKTIAEVLGVSIDKLMQEAEELN